MPATYIVPNVPLIPQDLGMSCWYASAQMVIQWRRSRLQMTEAAMADPGELSPTVNLYKANNGLPFTDMIRFSTLMGLQPVPLMTPTSTAIADWLQDYGPIWTAGKKVTPTQSYGHVVVIVGISSSQIRIHDPEPLNVGTRAWKPMRWLTTTLEWGANDWNVVNFLHCPA